ncbi:PHD and RING finger domain-containing protein 1, partial [Durusdinium trenchii]
RGMKRARSTGEDEGEARGGVADRDADGAGATEGEEDDAPPCTVCLNDIRVEGSGSKEPALLDGCVHVFHFECIMPWVQRSSTCPTCRAAVKVVTKSISQEKVKVVKPVTSSHQADFDVIEDFSEPCYVCDSDEDEASLLLCDAPGCSRTCHLNCCGLAAVPEGEWLCSECQRSESAALYDRVAALPNPPISLQGAGPEPTPRSRRGQRGRARLRRLEWNFPRDPTSQYGGQRPRLVNNTPQQISQRMDEALMMDLQQNRGLQSHYENRQALLPEVINHMHAWRRQGRTLLREEVDLWKSISSWLLPRGNLDADADGARIRFALLLQIRHWASHLSIATARNSEVAQNVSHCFRDDNETAQNKAVQQRIIASFQELSRANQRQGLDQARIELILRRSSAARAARQSFEQGKRARVGEKSELRRAASYGLSGTMKTLPTSQDDADAVRRLIEGNSSSSSSSSSSSMGPTKIRNTPVPQKRQERSLTAAERKKLISDSVRRQGRALIPAIYPELRQDQIFALARKAEKMFLAEFSDACQLALRSNDATIRLSSKMRPLEVIQATFGFSEDFFKEVAAFACNNSNDKQRYRSNNKNDKRAPRQQNKMQVEYLDGVARVTYANGDVYEGPFDDRRLKHGCNATYTFAGTGDEEAPANVYKGEYTDGERTGTGSMTFSDGSRYRGEWVKGFRQGMGSYTYQNGDIYSGEWKNSK